MGQFSSRDVLTDPPWRTEDLGLPLPDSPYAVSVSLPNWHQVIGYEEGDQDILDSLRTGYPRFFVPRIIKELEGKVLLSLGAPSGTGCLIFPDSAAAIRCQEFMIQRTDGWEIKTEEVLNCNASVVLYPNETADIAAKYWRYFGEGVSVRQAESLLAAKDETKDLGINACKEIREKIASDSGQNPEDVVLFPSGMAAVAATHRALTSLSPSHRSVQFDFPYVDVLRLQQEIGSGVFFLPSADESSVASLQDVVEGGESFCGVYCEVPSNPLLRSADLPKISSILSPLAIPLVVDDTVATNVNVDVFKYADLVTTSLTKYYSGVGDVIAGAVTVNRDSVHRERLNPLLSEQEGDGIWHEDAIVLKNNAVDYRERVMRVNDTTPQLVEWLMNHNEVERVWYPKYETRDNYDAVRKEGGGFSGLFSILLKNPESNSPAFYDSLELCKGPSLGVQFTIVCPYTLLAHYDELDWCEGLGVSRWLLRVSVGQEPFEYIRGRFEKALENMTKH
ncbi:MAG: PLP-dependent transferase [Verrucomicrobiales bacterium]|nr:PLP-dependent transferase [Verrucomicrobiales bacterium]